MVEITERLVPVADGVELAVHEYSSPSADAPVIVIWPAMGVPARYYRPFGASLREAGFAVTICDLRGTGGSRPKPRRGADAGYAELIGDVATVLGDLDLAGRDVTLLGHSLGGHLSALYQALHPDSPAQRLVIVASGTPYHRIFGPLTGTGVWAYTRFVDLTGAAVGWWPGHRLGFGGPQMRGVMRDWGYMIRSGRFPLLRGEDPEPAAAKLEVPILAVSVEGDRFTPPAALDHFCEQLPSADIIRHHHTAAESGRPMDHFTWVAASSALVERIRDFAGLSA